MLGVHSTRTRFDGAAVAQRVAVHSRQSGRNRRSIVIVGTGSSALEFAAALRSHAKTDLHVEGFLGPQGEGVGLGAPYLGEIEGLPRVLRERDVDEVGICLPTSMNLEIRKACEVSMTEGKTVRIRSDLRAPQLPTSLFQEFDGQSVVTVGSGPRKTAWLAAKRGLDIVGATVGLVALSPLFAAVAVAIPLSDGGPILFRQSRVGLRGRVFRVAKFRTMTPDADARRADLRQFNEVSGNASFKMTNDPRITSLGRFLRKSSIDELPQLWNVLRGEMSLVGPRPHPLDDVAGYDLWHRGRLTMKPGITGLWQVEGRRDADFDRWVRYDLEYIEHWSLWLDLRLILLTIPALLRAEGR
jgi:exopolysaccharide biosynthesis polyprenyl glycosylphosphotransferase